MAEKVVVQFEVIYGEQDPLAFTKENISQMYEKLEQMGKRHITRAMQLKDGKRYDVFQCDDGTEVWFDITEYFEELTRLTDAALGLRSKPPIQ